MKYFISVIGVVLCVWLLCLVSSGDTVVQLVHMGDLFTLLVILLVVITILAATGLHKDFIHAFQLALSKKAHASMAQLKRAKEAVDLTLRSIIGSGVMITSISIVQSLFLAESSALPANLGVSTLGIVYASCLYLLLLPIRAKLEVKIMEYMEE